jgi:membrane-associated phospholipid phosphatase
MGQHWMFLTLIGFIVGLSVIICLWWVYGRLLLSNGPKGQSLRRRLPFWRRSSRPTQADTKRDYELLDHTLENRHDV